MDFRNTNQLPYLPLSFELCGMYKQFSIRKANDIAKAMNSQYETHLYRSDVICKGAKVMITTVGRDCRLLTLTLVPFTAASSECWLVSETASSLVMDADLESVQSKFVTDEDDVAILSSLLENATTTPIVLAQK